MSLVYFSVIGDSSAESATLQLIKEKTGVEYLPGACFIDIG